MPTITVKCSCGQFYQTTTSNQARGWGMSCSKSCAQRTRQRNAKRVIPDDQWDSIIARYTQGESIASIEGSLNPKPPHRSVRKGLVERGIPIRNAHQAIFARYNRMELANHPNLEQWGKDVLKAYYDGMPLKEIKATLGADKQVIEKLRAKHDLPPRANTKASTVHKG